MKRKLSAIVLACMMACLSLIGLVGCGGDPLPDFTMPKGGFNTEKEVEIKFYHTMGQNLQKVLDTYIKEFNKLFPNIIVSAEQVGDYDAVRNRIMNELSAGNQPNVAYCYPDHVAMYNNAKATLPLNDFLPGGEHSKVTVKHADGTTEPLGLTQEQKDSFIEGYYKEGYQFGNGKTMYTLPFSKSTELLYYNKTFFDKHNLKVPTTWDEMEEVCKKIKDGDGENEAIAPNCTAVFGYDSEANWFINMCEQSGSAYTSSTGNKYRFDNKENRAFVTKFKGWYDKGYFTTHEINKNYTSNLFKEQNCYMCIGSSAGATSQRPTKGDNGYPFEVGITSIPQVSSDPKKAKVISQGPSVCIFKNDDPQKVLASWLFVKFLTTSVGFQAQFSSVSGYVPVITTVTQNETYKKNLDAADGGDNIAYLAAKTCMEQVDAYYTSPAFVGSSKAREEVGYLMQAVFTNSKTVNQAFKDAIEECEYDD